MGGKETRVGSGDSLKLFDYPAYSSYLADSFFFFLQITPCHFVLSSERPEVGCTIIIKRN